MAESQVFYAYSPDKMAAIRANLSEARFARYLGIAGGHEEYAIALYLYNARVAKSFLYPLHIVEVTVRNAIDEILVQTYGLDWHTNLAFVTGLLHPDGQSTLAKAITRAGLGANRNQIVATLTFDFWSHMLRPEYHTLWRTKFNVAFPGIPGGETRHSVQQIVKTINKFRNRVAHHEPVLDLNITDVHAKILMLVSWRSPHAADWLRHFSTVSTIIRHRPTLAGSSGPVLSTRADTNFIVCSPDEQILQVLQRITDRTAAFVSIDEHAAPVVAFTTFDIVKYITVSAQMPVNGGMIDLSDHTINDLVANSALGDKWVGMNENAPLYDAIQVLKGPRIRVLVSQGDNGVAAGVIVRAHRRY